MRRISPAPFVIVLIVATLVLVLFGQPARAQTYSTFVFNMFEDLYAERVSCTALGLDERPYDFSDCGWIDDNLVETNKRIIERNVREHGYTVVQNWKRDGSVHQIGFTKSSANIVFIINYGELDASNSVVWVIGNYY